MTQVITLVSAGLISFLGHQFVEKLVTWNRTKNFRFVFRGYQIHHSVWGLAAIATAIIFTSGVYATVLVGYGLGNIWQHKVTHNKVNEKGLVFISKILKG